VQAKKKSENKRVGKTRRQKREKQEIEAKKEGF